MTIIELGQNRHQQIDSFIDFCPSIKIKVWAVLFLRKKTISIGGDARIVVLIVF